MAGGWKNFFKIFGLSLKEFFQEDGLDKASVLAYYSIFSSVFLLTFLTFLFTRFIGNPDAYLTSLYPFTPDFSTKISPDIFLKAKAISSKLQSIGFMGIAFSIFLGILVLKKIIQYVNEMFLIKFRKGFLIKRIKEFALMFFIAIFMVLSFLLTSFISTLTGLFNKNKFISTYINPVFIESINHFILKYMLPFVLTFIIFFILYKWIPEKKIATRAALISALIATVLWEIVKRSYAYYLLNLSIIGKIKGPIIAIILFGFWMEFSTGILLFGAKLTHNLDKKL